jgi:hypothetical protein
VSAAGVKLVSQAVVSVRKPSSIVEQKTLKDAEPKREATPAPNGGTPQAPNGGTPPAATPDASAPSVSVPAPAAAPTVVAAKHKRNLFRRIFNDDEDKPRGVMTDGSPQGPTPSEPGFHGKHRLKRDPGYTFPMNAL